MYKSFTATHSETQSPYMLSLVPKWLLKNIETHCVSLIYFFNTKRLHCRESINWALRSEKKRRQKPQKTEPEIHTFLWGLCCVFPFFSCYHHRNKSVCLHIHIHHILPHEY